MYSSVTKVKTNLSEDRRFHFDAQSTIPPGKRMRLVIASTGCPAQRIEAGLFDRNDVRRNQVGAPEQDQWFSGNKDSTDGGDAVWNFSASECAGGYLKWRIWPAVSDTGQRTYSFTATIEGDGWAVHASVMGTIADEACIDTPILDGVPISEGSSPSSPAVRATGPGGPFFYAFGSSGEAVGDLQRKLAMVNVHLHGAHTPFYAGPCDGFYNRGMQKAVKQFRQAHHLTSDATGCDDTACDAATWHKINDEAGSVFAEIWQFEFDALRGEMPLRVEPVEESQLIRKAHGAGMAGLAFSGGGVRSATFNLGVLQALGELHLLRHFDYLSTVSGGGYIGAWLSKWLKRMRGDIDRMELKLSPSGNPAAGKSEPEEIRFLRQFSNYLTAKTGFFSADTWSVLATYARNMLLNMTMLVAGLVALLVLLRTVVFDVAKNALNPTVPIGANSMGWYAGLAIGAALWSVFWIAVSISTKPDPALPKWRSGQSQASIIVGIVGPLMLAAVFGSIVLWAVRGDMYLAWHGMTTTPATTAAMAAEARHNVAIWLLAPGVCYFLVWACGWGLAQHYNSKTKAAAQTPRVTGWHRLLTKAFWQQSVKLFKDGIGHFLCALAALSVGSLLVILTTTALANPALSTPPNAVGPAVHVLAFGMPLLLALFAVTTILSVGLVGRMYSEKSREWWSRQSGWTAIFVVAWLAIVSMSLYAPAVLAYAHVKSPRWASSILGATWVGSTVAGLLAGVGKGRQAGARPQPGRAAGVIIAVAPYIFATGLLMLASGLVHWLSAGAESAAPTEEFLSIVNQYNAQTLDSDRTVLAWMLVASLLTAALLAWRIDINRFSLHMMYRNRLVRAYLGASNVARRPHPFTGFDEQDDLDFSDLLETDRKIQRPYHIMNCTLNMVHGKQLAWQTRKAGGFAFTPAFCGFELPSMAAPGGPKIADEAQRGCYRRTAGYRPVKAGEKTEDSGIKLGMAMAVSGAAVSPNWGKGTTPALAFLMTLFNLRLGRWFANPRRKLKPGEQTSPRVGMVPLLSELFGLTDAESDFVYLSDGGHFENLAVYELVRRRCRLIVVVDASADARLDFGDMGNAIRKCATDLHIDITLNVARIDPLRGSQLSRDHCVAGLIDYSKADGAYAKPGILLYIKPSLVGTETAELLNYSKTSPAFPYQSTADQWFDETQFESYRSLGYQIAKLALEDAEKYAADAAHGGSHIDRLCEAIKAKWCRNNVGAPCPPSRHAANRGPERRRWDAAGQLSTALLQAIRRGPERRRRDTA